MNRPHLPLLVLLLLVAFALRVHDLTHNALWLDELFTASFAAGMGADTVVHIMVSDVHPPVYYAQLHGWLRVMGTSDFSLRLNTVFLSFITLALLYRFTRQRWGAKMAFWTALFWALSATSIYYAQQARMYSLLMLLGVLVWAALDRLLKQPRTYRTQAAYILVMLLFLYSQGVALLLLFATTAYAVGWWLLDWRERQERFGIWFMIQALITLLYTPWLFLAANMGVNHTDYPDLAILARTATEFLLGYGTGYSPIVQVVLLLVVGGVLVLGLRRVGLVLLAYVLTPLAVTYAVSYALRPIWLTRSLVFMLPFILLGGAALLPKSRWATWLLGGSMAAVFALGTLHQYRTFQPEWTIATPVEFGKTQLQAGETVLFPKEVLFWLWSWYFVDAGTIRPRITESVTNGQGVTFAYIGGRDLNEVLHAGQTYWFIWDEVFPYDDFERCVANFDVNEAIQVAQIQFQRVRVVENPTLPLCQPKP